MFLINMKDYLKRYRIILEIKDLQSGDVQIRTLLQNWNACISISIYSALYLSCWHLCIRFNYRSYASPHNTPASQVT
jgi:hypothetical protein